MNSDKECACKILNLCLTNIFAIHNMYKLFKPIIIVGYTVWHEKLTGVIFGGFTIFDFSQDWQIIINFGGPISSGHFARVLLYIRNTNAIPW